MEPEQYQLFSCAIITTDGLWNGLQRQVLIILVVDSRIMTER
jgi:hypothetical protein